MKRSEAIKKLAVMFEEHSNNQQYKGYSHEGLAETFLDLAEKIGMLPPFVCNEEICCQNEWESEETTQWDENRSSGAV